MPATPSKPRVIRFQDFVNGKYVCLDLTLDQILKGIDREVDNAILEENREALEAFDTELGAFEIKIGDHVDALSEAAHEAKEDEARELSEEAQALRRQELREIAVSQIIEAQNLDTF